MALTHSLVAATHSLVAATHAFVPFHDGHRAARRSSVPATHIDLAEAVARGLQIVSPGFPDAVASLVQHAKGKPTKKRG